MAREAFLDTGLRWGSRDLVREFSVLFGSIFVRTCWTSGTRPRKLGYSVSSGCEFLLIFDLASRCGCFFAM